MTRDEFERMVKETARRFSDRHKMPVSDGSIGELITPGLPHLDDVTAAINSGQVTKEFLEDCVHSVLTGAWKVAKERNQNVISEPTVQESMKRYCPYLFWC